MLDSKGSCPGWFEFGDLGKVIDESLGISSVVTRPECGFAYGNDSGHCHSLVVLRRTGDTVVVRLYDLHGKERGLVNLGKMLEKLLGAVCLGMLGFG